MQEIYKNDLNDHKNIVYDTIFFYVNPNIQYWRFLRKKLNIIKILLLPSYIFRGVFSWLTVPRCVVKC